MIAKKQKPTPQIIVGKTASQLNEPWYARKGNATDLAHAMKFAGKPKAVSYFKVNQRTRGGSKLEEIYYKTLCNGYMVYVDVANIKIGVVQGMGSFYAITGSAKQEFVKAQKQVLQFLTIT